ncbi:MAG: hypothetical protein ACOX6J_05745 [Oscillospiraceae bacterium]
MDRKLDKLAKIISIVTLVPCIALLSLILLLIWGPHSFRNVPSAVLYVFCLSVMPILAYPLQKFFPKYRDKGRDGQRRLAFIFALCGYTLGLAASLILHSPVEYLAIFMSYFISGVVLSIFNLLHIKASGHACGVAGQCVFCGYFIGGWGWLMLIFIPLVFWARLRMKRHKLLELVLGASISAVTTAVLILTLC